MLKTLDPAVKTIASAAVLALTLGYAIQNFGAGFAPVASVAHAQTAAPTAAPQWAASATGRVEPRDGEVRIAPQVPGRIVEVLAAANDKVEAGDLLVRLDDQEYYVKIAAALAEVSVREREREEEKATGLALERRNAHDAVAKAERGLYAARESFDAALKAAKGGNNPADAVAAARKAMVDAEAKVSASRRDLANVNAKPDMPLQQRLESSLETARAELTSYELALERTRVRAPGTGTVLNMLAKVGETAVPSPEASLVVFGDLTGLRLRAEVEERDAAKVRAGQGVVVKADAFPDKTFTGSVTSISQSLGAARIATRGPRRPNDVEVVEVMVTLDGNPPLFTGMRVDAFFKAEGAANAGNAAPAKTN